MASDLADRPLGNPAPSTLLSLYSSFALGSAFGNNTNSDNNREDEVDQTEVDRTNAIG